MNSSGIKRGLAATAISALAVSGIPALASSASADTIDQQAPSATGTELYTQDSGFASVQNDGVNTTVHLLAGGGTNVNQVRFEYGPAGSPTTIATVARTNGVFSTEWAPPVATYGTSVEIRAVGLNSVGNPTGGATGTATATISADRSAIDIANAAGSVVPIFQQPYGLEAQEGAGMPGNGVTHSTAQGAVTGTTSGNGAVTISDLSDGSTPRPAVTPGAASNGVRPFKGTVNFADYTPFTATNQAIVGVSQAGGSDDAEVVNLEKQTIGDATAVATPATIPNNAGSTSSAVITVTDNTAAKRPIAGAQVIADADNDGVWDANENSYYTNGDGQVTVTGLPGSTGSGTTYAFFVNVDGDDDYQPAKDFRRTVTIVRQNQVPTTITSASADGAAFDSDEYFAGDVTAKLVDQNGTGIPNAQLSYRVVFTPAVATTPPTTYPAQTGSATTNAQGVATIPVALQAVNGSYAVQAYQDTDGTPGQTGGDLAAAPLTFKAGDSSLVFDDAPSANAAAGTTATFDATLKLYDGTPLAGRLVDFTYAPTADSQLAAQAQQPAGTTRNGATARDTTDAAGKVSVAISDPSAPAQTAELDSTLTATTADNPANTADGNDDPDETGDLDVDFGITNPPAGTTDVTVVLGNNAGSNKPGVASGANTVTVTGDANGPAAGGVGPIAGISVTLTVDNEGFFTDGSADPAPAAGNDLGELKSLGESYTVVTNANGVAQVRPVAMERNDDFDDDGMAEAMVKATVASASDTEDYDFDSSNPLNGGAVELTQVSGVTDGPTRVDDGGISYDVKTTDQFGNVVGGATVNFTENGAGTTASPASITSDFDDSGDVTLNASVENSGTLTGTWNAPFAEYGVGPAFTPVTGTRNLTDTADFAFYEIDFDKSTFTLGQIGDETVKVGTRVTEKLTVLDQFDAPVEGLEVEFLRAGPSTEDSDGNDYDSTDENGNAFYDFVGGSEGTANISAVVRDNGTRVTSLDDTVTFSNGGGTPEPDGKDDVLAKTKGRNNGGKNDVVTIKTSSQGMASRVQVKLFKVIGNKTGNKRVLVAIKRVDIPGKVRFVVKDENGGKKTRYFAKVKGTATTKFARSNNRGLR